MQAVAAQNDLESSTRWRITWPDAFAFAAILGGIILRWIALGRPSLWYDEGYTAWIVSHPTREIIRLIQNDTAPPLYYILLRGWVIIFGRSEAALRSLSALISSIGLIVFYPLATRILRDRATAAIAVMLAATSYMQVEHAREARFYPLMVLLAELALWLVLQAAERPARGRYAAIVLVWALCLYTNNIMAFYLAGLGLAWLILPGARTFRGRMIDLSIVSIATALIYLPWLPTAMMQARLIKGNFWAQVPSKFVLLRTTVMLAGANEHALGPWSRRNTGAAILLIALAGLIGLVRRETHRATAGLIAFGLLPVFVVYIYSHIRQSIFVDRSLIPTSVILPLIVGMPMTWISRTRARWLLPACGLVLLIPCLYSLQLDRFTRNFEDWRSVCRDVAARSTERQLIIFVGNEGELLYDYYLRGGDYSRQPNLTGAPVEFLASNPPHTMQRVRSEKDLDGVKATLASGEYDQVVLVDCHFWWSDSHRLTQKFLDDTMVPLGGTSFGNIVVRRWTARRWRYVECPIPSPMGTWARGQKEINVPSIIDYSLVLERLQAHGLKSLYFNSGAFGFPANVFSRSLGWIGPLDASIKPEARAIARNIPAPFEKNLADLAERAWRELLPGRVWVMPKSHWAYELDFAHREWLPPLLLELGIRAISLEGVNNAAAIEFMDAEHASFRLFVQTLLERLTTSDFLMAFPQHRTVCTIHSHKQLWWTTGDLLTAKGLAAIVPP